MEDRLMFYNKWNNMKYTDGLFSLPVRIYDKASLKRIKKLEEDAEIVQDGDWVEGIADIPYDNIKGVIDYYSPGRSPEEVATEGFDCCVVVTMDFGEFLCNKSRKWVKEKLDTFYEGYTAKVEKMVDTELERKLNGMVPTKNKQGFFYKLYKKSR